MGQPQLDVKGINTFYGKSQILHNVSIFVNRGELIGLLGRNGVGKTTTLKSIMGTVVPRSGSIFFEGEDIVGLPPFKIARRGVSLVPENRRVFPTLTVRENLLMGIKSWEGQKSQGAEWSIERVYDYFPGLKERDSHKARYLSGGEQQMLSIGRALMGNPKLLLLDEPTEGLAPIIVTKLCGMISLIHQIGASILLVEESMKVILQICQKVYVMVKGKIVFEGSAKELEQNVDVRKKYLEV